MIKKLFYLFLCIFPLSAYAYLTKPYENKIMGGWGYLSDGGFWDITTSPNKMYPKVNTWFIEYSQPTTFFKLPSDRTLIIGTFTGIPFKTQGLSGITRAATRAHIEPFFGYEQGLSFFFPWTKKRLEFGSDAGFVFKTFGEAEPFVKQYYLAIYTLYGNYYYKNYMVGFFFRHMSSLVNLETMSYNFSGIRVGYRW